MYRLCELDFHIDYRFYSKLIQKSIVLRTCTREQITIVFVLPRLSFVRRLKHINNVCRRWLLCPPASYHFGSPLILFLQGAVVPLRAYVYIFSCDLMQTFLIRLHTSGIIGTRKLCNQSKKKKNTSDYRVKFDSFEKQRR